MTPDGEPEPPDAAPDGAAGSDARGETDEPSDGAEPIDIGDGDVAPDGDAAALLPPDGVRSRADLQKQLRRSHRKERKRQHRWRRRIIYGLAFVVVVAALGVGGIYVYATYRFDQIKKVHAKHLIAQSADPGKPFDLLIVGSDSRAFVGDNPTLSSEIGNEANAGGQRSDVTMVARFDPAAKTVTVLSIPRDLWVDIPGDDSGISGMNRINAAFDSGPDLLVQTIEKDLGIPVNHYVAVNFPGFSSMVNALGGITLDFPTAVKDQYTGLYVTQTGCQVVNGITALQLVRSRHLYYMNSKGYWEYDGLSDFSRIQRQDAFFRAVLQKINGSITNPLAINSFISAAVGNLTIDDTLSEGDILHIAEVFRGLPSSHLVTETLPTTALVTDGGADVLQVAQPYAQNMINAFNAIGTTPPPTTTTTTTTVPSIPHSQIDVNVLNASTANGIAHTTATALTAQGFHVPEVGDATTELASGGPSEILYGPEGYAAAKELEAVLSGPVTLTADPSLTGQTVSLLIAGSELTVTASTGATTTTTVPAAGTSTTIPSDVYSNVQPEPWNPYPCTLASASPSTTATTSHKAKGAAATTTTSTTKAAPSVKHPTTTTKTPSIPHAQVTVNVFNASTVPNLAHGTALALSAQGFYVGEIADASTRLASGGPSEILYGPRGYGAALALGSVLNGPVAYMADSGLSGQTVELLVSGSSLTVKPVATTTTTAPKATKK